MDYKIEISGLERHLPICRVNDDIYIGAFIMFGDVEITRRTAEALLDGLPEFDVVITAESKGIPLAYEMSRRSGKPYVVARKEPKLYMEDVLSVRDISITTDHEQSLCLGRAEREVIHGRRVLIADDVVSTGGSMSAIEKLVDGVGGHVVARAAVLAEGEASKMENLKYLQVLPLFNADGSIKQ